MNDNHTLEAIDAETGCFCGEQVLPPDYILVPRHEYAGLVTMASYYRLLADIAVGERGYIVGEIIATMERIRKEGDKPEGPNPAQEVS